MNRNPLRRNQRTQRAVLLLEAILSVFILSVCLVGLFNAFLTVQEAQRQLKFKRDSSVVSASIISQYIQMPDKASKSERAVVDGFSGYEYDVAKVSILREDLYRITVGVYAGKYKRLTTIYLAKTP